MVSMSNSYTLKNNFRLAEETDIEKIYTIISDGINEVFRDDSSARDSMILKWSEECIADFINARKCLVFELDNDILGVTIFSGSDFGVNTIIWFLIDSSYSNRGYGSSFLQYCKDKLKGHKIRLTARNGSAIRFYERNGFTVQSVLRNHWHNLTFTCLEYEKKN